MPAAMRAAGFGGASPGRAGRAATMPAMGGINSAIAAAKKSGSNHAGFVQRAKHGPGHSSAGHEGLADRAEHLTHAEPLLDAGAFRDRTEGEDSDSGSQGHEGDQSPDEHHHAPDHPDGACLARSR